MLFGALEVVSKDMPLATAVDHAVALLRKSGQPTTALMFDISWHPTMDVVGAVATALNRAPEITSLVLIHPSAAMSVIAAAISARAPLATVTSRRSLHDDEEEDEVEVTESKALIMMEAAEALDRFVRRAVGQARQTGIHRVALAFDKDSRPTLGLADVLVEELVQSGVREIGLIHPSVSLDAIAAAVRLRLPRVLVAVGTERKT